MPHFAMFNTVKRNSLQTLTWVAVLSLTVGSGATYSQSLETLSEADRLMIEDQCLPVQYQSGAAAYRECVNEQISIANQGPTSTPSDISFDEQFAIQRYCQRLGVFGSPAYDSCATSQTRELAEVPVPRLSRLSDDERYALLQDCVDIQNSGGAKAYRQCINTTLNEVLTLSVPDLSGLSVQEKIRLQLRCSAQQTRAMDYRSCLLDATAGADTVPAAPQVSDDSNVESPQAEVAEPVSAEADTAQETGKVNEAFTRNLETPTEPDTNALGSSDRESPIESAEQVVESNTGQLPASTQDISPIDNNSPEIAADFTIPDTGTNDPISALPADTDITSNATDARDEAQQQSDFAALELPLETAPVIDNDPIESQTLPQADPSVETQSSLVSQDPVLSSEQNQSDTSAATLPDSGNSTNTSDAGVVERLKLIAAELPERIGTMLNGVSGINRVVVMAAAALPFLLIGFWLVARRRSPEPAYIPPVHPNPLKDRINPSLQGDARDDWERSDREELSLTDTNDLSQQMDELFQDLPETPREPDTQRHPKNGRMQPASSIPEREQFPDENTAPTAFPDKSQQTATVNNDTRLKTASNQDANPAESPLASAAAAVSDSAFTQWINQRAPEKQLSVAIEFLIYWIAYGDERYEPELRKKIFMLEDPDDHDVIKRHVLMNDFQAFADTISWIQNHSSPELRTQILKLLLTLLVSENALTPVQNTLLRFLSDAFGFGHTTLDQLHRQFFGQALPPLARADKPQWWDLQDLESPKRWDARSVARQSRDIQYRVKLGLPLTGDIDEEMIMSSYERAEARCLEQHFTLLTDRESALVERQLIKFGKARDELLEVLV